MLFRSILLTPFITLWVGAERTLAFSVIGCILIDFYFKGERIVLSNFKTAAGVFEQDKYLALIQGVVNLVISIVLVVRIGLVGVYIGTIVSGLIANVTKPIIIYHVILDRKAGEYFRDSVKYCLMLAGQFALFYGISKVVMPVVTMQSFLIMFVIISILFNVIFAVLFWKTGEFQYLVTIVKGKFRKRKE